MKLPKPISYALRLIITAGAGYLALSNVHPREIWPLLASIAPVFLLAALVLVHAGQIISALRTSYYLHCSGIDFPVNPSIRLHYVGGLFNTFLPGGAGGDAYKAWWLKRHKQGRMLNMVKLMVAVRLNGLWALGVLICVMAFCSAPVRNAIPYANLLIPATAVAGTLGYMLLARVVLKEPVRQQLRAALYSFALQLMLAAVAFTLCAGLGHQADAFEYALLFMLSCMLAMLPISIGGIGVRELALLHGSKLLHLSEETGVTLAFTFTIISLTIPLVGAVIHNFYAPEGKKVTHGT